MLVDLRLLDLSLANRTADLQRGRRGGGRNSIIEPRGGGGGGD